MYSRYMPYVVKEYFLKTCLKSKEISSFFLYHLSSQESVHQNGLIISELSQSLTMLHRNIRKNVTINNSNFIIMKTMNSIYKTSLTFAVLALVFAGCQKEQLEPLEGLNTGIKKVIAYPMEENVPSLIDPWKSGDAASECGQVPCCESAFHYKFDDWGEQETPFDGSYMMEDGNIISISNNDGYFFDFTSDSPVSCVIVKGGTGALVYCFGEPVFSGTALYAPIRYDKDGNSIGICEISHVTFCYNESEKESEWVGETAWVAGSRYVSKGNWATYSQYASDKSLTLYAGQTKKAGEVHFSTIDLNGNVTITIELNEGWRLEMDEAGSIVEEAVKILGYTNTPAAKNPSPGQFNTYKGTDLEITIPAFKYFGIHLNVEWEKCD
jgi:hypothetical protein